jgi:hypothetical protein
MVRVRKGAVQIRFEILEYLFYNREPQPRTYVWRKATSLSYDDFLYELDKEWDRFITGSPDRRDSFFGAFAVLVCASACCYKKQGSF